MFHFKSVLSFILLALMAGVNVARGETKPFTIVIDRVGAEPLRIEIKKSTEITFSEGNAVITSANEAPQTIPLEDLANMSFDGDMSSVEETLMTFDSGHNQVEPRRCDHHSRRRRVCLQGILRRRAHGLRRTVGHGSHPRFHHTPCRGLRNRGQ